MKRLNNPLLLSNEPFFSLIEDIQYILATDKQDHSVQVEIYHKMLAKGEKSVAYLEKMRTRLQKGELRYDYINALVCRLQCHDFIRVILALERAIEEAKIRENCKTMYPKKYGFTIQFHQSEVDCLIL